jgi:hypothetical protein
LAEDDALAVTLRVAALLERLEVRYAVVGSLASSFHGIPRSTQDADVLAELEERHVEAWLASLEHAYYVDEERVRQAIAAGASFNVIYLATMFKVDVFVPGDDPLSASELRRRQRIELESSGEGESSSLWIASAEDTLLHKLVWYRLGGETSERQWRDVVGVIQVQGEALDLGYLESWAGKLDLTRLLDRALDRTQRDGG